MKFKNKALTVFAALALAGTSLAPAQMLITNIIQTFDANDASGNKWGHEWGAGTQAWDGTTGNPPGALLITAPLTGASDHPTTTYITQNGNPWYVGTPINFSSYDYLELDIKWDTTSDVTIAQFNNVGIIPPDFTNSLGQPFFNTWAMTTNYIGGTGGLDIYLCGGSGGQMSPFIVNTNIPAAAASGWTHIKIPINKTLSGIDGVSGIVFSKWVSQNWGILNPAQARFWVDNVMLTGTAVPPPPPTVKIPTKATPGLNVFASTAGLYDRQSAVLRQSTGLSWVGVATPANPVSYSFTIAGYPNSPDCEAYLFLIPNPAYLDGAPDWNETNCVVIYLQGNASSATMHFRYKVNEPNQQAMYSGGNETRGYYTNAPGSWDGVTTNYLESGNLGFVTNNGVLGTWTVKFTSDTNLTLIAPNGNSASLVFPNYNVGYFAEQAVPGFYAYLGMQANNANAMNQAVVYANFAVSNSVMPFSENFLADSVLDTTTIWNTGPAAGPKGVFIAPAGSSGWVTWSLPDPGFGLEAATTLSDPLAWTSPSTGPIIAMNGIRAQLVSSNEWPAGNTAFFRLVKRTFTQLQVLLPGQTNAPNTTLGYVGSPTPISLAAQGSTPTTVTVNAVDATYHVINGVIDSIHLTTTDGSAFMPADMQMVNGTASFTGSSGVLFQTSGSQTVTATDTTNTNIPAATSAAVTIAP